MAMERAVARLNKGDTKGFRDEVTIVLENIADPSYREFCKHLHIKNPLGVPRKTLKTLADDIVKNAKCDRSIFLKGGKKLWRAGTSEHRAIAILMLSFLVQRDADFPLVLSSHFIRKAAGNCDSWELADDFGMNVLGLILARDIYQLDEILTWAEDDNPWLRRALGVAAWGLYKHSKRKGQNRVDCSLELLGRLMTSSEKEVQFGVMWPLRMFCKYEASHCIPFVRHWTEKGDENTDWILDRATDKLNTFHHETIVEGL